MDIMTIQIIIALIGVAGAFAGIFMKFGKIETKIENNGKLILAIREDISAMNTTHAEDMREFRKAHEESMREIRGVFTKHIENPMAHGNWSADASKA